MKRQRLAKRMRVAFYAPLKPPDHPVASGDRAMARALIAALRAAGHDVSVASRLRSYDSGDPARQMRLRDLGAAMARRVMRRMGRAGRPEEVAATIAFLASGEACYICGALVELTGAKPVY